MDHAVGKEEKQRAEDDLKLIRSVMEACARKQQDNGIYHILWGSLIPAMTAVTYVLVSLKKFRFIGPLWGISMVLGAAAGILIGIKRRRRVPSQADRFHSAIWLAAGGSICVVFILGYLPFFSAGRNIPLNILMMMLSFLLANAVFISGTLSAAGVLKFSAAGWWIAGIICFFMPQYRAPLVVAAATLLFELIPGIVLDRRYRNERLRLQKY